MHLSSSRESMPVEAGLSVVENRRELNSSRVSLVGCGTSALADNGMAAVDGCLQCEPK